MKEDGTKIKICVAGTSDVGYCGVEAQEKAKELGKEIARYGITLMTGTLPGFSMWSAMGSKEGGGIVFGLSPASDEREHKEVYRLKTDYHDAVIYTGFGSSGRNLMLTRSADAVIVGCGSIGSMNEFTIAYEAGKIIGILGGDWLPDDILTEIIKSNKRPSENIIFDDNPIRLISRLVEKIKDKEKTKLKIYG